MRYPFVKCLNFLERWKLDVSFVMGFYKHFKDIHVWEYHGEMRSPKQHNYGVNNDDIDENVKRIFYMKDTM